MASFFDKLKKGMDVEKQIDAEDDSGDNSASEKDASSKPLKRKKFLNLVGNARNKEKTSRNDITNKEEKVETKKKRNEKKEIVKFLALSEDEEKREKRKETLQNSTTVAASPTENGRKKKKMRKKNKTEKIEENKEKMKKIEVKDKEDEKFAFFDKSERKKDKKLFEPEGELTVDIYQTDNDIVIQSVIAGVTPENIDISIENDMIVIRGNREKPFEEGKRKYFFKECYWGRFSREIVSPEEVDNSRIQASLKNGVLTIRMPKIERSKKRKIIIKE